MAVQIFIVDDEVDVADSIQDILTPLSADVQKFHNGEDFFRSWRGDLEGVVLLDMKLPGVSGLQVLSQMKETTRILPVIMIASLVDIQLAVGAIKAGAFDFIAKPFSADNLLEKVHMALAYNRRMLDTQRVHADVLSSLSQLTGREREILDLIVEGQTSRSISGSLGISVYTVDNHRARILDKMRATTTGHLVQMVVNATARLSTQTSA